jgi:hypothetical protein
MTGHDALRLKWRKTWPEVENDFAARTETGEPVGRIYRHDTGGSEPSWFWSMHGFASAGLKGTARGRAPSPRDAAGEVEREWFVLLGI